MWKPLSKEISRALGYSSVTHARMHEDSKWLYVIFGWCNGKFQNMTYGITPYEIKRIEKLGWSLSSITTTKEDGLRFEFRRKNTTI